MIMGKNVTLVAIAYNEEKMIIPTLKAVPDFVDHVLVVDDASTDSTPDLVAKYAKEDSRVRLIRHLENRGPGGAIISGYMWFYRNGGDVAIVVGGDHQMDQSEMQRFIAPIAKGEAGYCKGNRFLVDAFDVMPWRRLLGNTILSALTVLISGYWTIFDTQDGYTSISRDAVEKIDWAHFYEGYGYVSDFIIRMKPFGIKIKDVPRRSIYLTGERQSQIKIDRYIRKFFSLWIRAFRWRIGNAVTIRSHSTSKWADERRKMWKEIT
jgi:glycosyltransferase involved in cell wall biosynthesis